MSRATPSLVRLSWDEAGRHCPGRCLYYHRIRPLLRRLGLASEPEDHRAFMFPAIVAALGEAGRRVLVSGSADEAMAAMVVEAGQAAGVTPDITVVDLCATPLLLNAAFGAAHGVAIATERSDILGYRSPACFDLIVTHSFLGVFAPAQRRSLMSRWHDLLRPGGRLVTVARLRPRGESRRFSDRAAADLAEEARRRTSSSAATLGLPAHEIAAAVLDYARHRAPSHPLRSLDELSALVSGAGLEPVQVRARNWPARVTGIDGPGLPRGGAYAEVVAERRA